MTDLVAEVTACEDRRWEAMIAKDTDALAAMFAEEMSYTHSNASVDTKASYLKAIEDRVFDYRSADRTDTQVTVIGDTGLVTGRVAIGVVARGNELSLDARYTVTWVRRNAGWEFLSWQSTPKPA